MSFQAFVKFALICFDALAWPLFALGYPLRASILAIEDNSITDTKKLVTYWVIFSLISLFEHAFMGMLQWLPFWPYMKLTIVCWMMIPRFDGAFYVYNHFIHPCLYIDMQTIINWFKKQQEFVLKDNFLAEADRYVKAHGPEALEKLIASKVPETEPNNALTVNNIITGPRIKEAAVCHPPEIPSEKQVQKEWTCAMCQVTTTSEKTLNSHLQGRRHRNASEELMKAKNQPSKGKVSFASVVWDKNSDLPHNEPQIHASSTSIQASQKMQQTSVSKNYDLPRSNTSTSSKAVNPEAGTSKSNLPKEEPKKSLPNKTAGNKEKPSEKVQGEQQAQKKDAEIKIPQFWCTICKIRCNSSEDLNCHLWGRKHLARIQQLDSLGRGKLA
ncbi:uncharacterized protein LOC111281825 isoform X2 [Durio zibethinus]|uniref:HVA22-like protein n=1 Tax=Durio zibethinus TaxID=66656 RepID=A0A6P5XBS1_DURZI|nr:uncharacterized protein LOC111281825 isoform X2 [Durio zibethinus]